MVALALAIATACSSGAETTATTTLPATSDTSSSTAGGPEPVEPGRTSGTEAPPEAFDALAEPADDPGTVTLYGDSLVQQSFTYTAAIAGDQGWNLVGGGFGGLALCDVLESLERSVRKDRPSVVVLAFVGNAITPCITDGGDPSAGQIARRYGRDARRAVGIARAGGARVILIAPPHMRTPDREVVAQAITRQWRRLERDTPGVTVVDAAAALTPGGYSDTLACRAYETAALGCRDGRIVVRQSDGTHLSPPFGTSGYSAGGWRYAEILTSGV